VVICGAYGRGNAGDDAILEAILQEMRSIDPDMPLTVLSKDPKETTRLTYRVRAVGRMNIPAWRPGHAPPQSSTSTAAAASSRT
jgi:polysaccharide pyruvyl transferase WcaK-like protein